MKVLDVDLGRLGYPSVLYRYPISLLHNEATRIYSWIGISRFTIGYYMAASLVLYDAILGVIGIISI